MTGLEDTSSEQDDNFTKYEMTGDEDKKSDSKTQDSEVLSEKNLAFAEFNSSKLIPNESPELLSIETLKSQKSMPNEDNAPSSVFSLANTASDFESKWDSAEGTESNSSIINNHYNQVDDNNGQNSHGNISYQPKIENGYEFRHQNNNFQMKQQNFQDDEGLGLAHHHHQHRSGSGSNYGNNSYRNKVNTSPPFNSNDASFLDKRDVYNNFNSKPVRFNNDDMMPPRFHYNSNSGFDELQQHGTSRAYQHKQQRDPYNRSDFEQDPRGVFSKGIGMSNRIAISSIDDQILASGGYVYQVIFKCNHAYYLLHPSAMNIQISTGDHVIVEADRGKDLGVVGELIHVERFMAHRFTASSKKVLKSILRPASIEEIQELTTKGNNEIVVVNICRKILETTHRLPITIVDAEYQYDRNKLTIYHDLRRRVDFREFVRDLFAVFKTRIWMQLVNSNSSLRRNEVPGGTNNKSRISSTVHDMAEQLSSNTHLGTEDYQSSKELHENPNTRQNLAHINSSNSQPQVESFDDVYHKNDFESKNTDIGAPTNINVHTDSNLMHYQREILVQEEILLNLKKSMGKELANKSAELFPSHLISSDTTSSYDNNILWK